MLIVGERHLSRVLTEYTTHYNGHTDRSTTEPAQVVDLAAARVQRHPLLGGLINEYTQAA